MSTTQENPDVISDECLDASNAQADVIFSELIEEFDEMRDDGLDPVAIVYALWISFIYVLVDVGWTPSELAKDLAHHGHNNDVEGHA